MAASSEVLTAPMVAERGKAGAGKGKMFAVVALALAVAAVAFVFLKPGAAESAPAEAVAPKPGPVVDVGDMTVNLAEAGRYARVSFSLVLAEGTPVGAEGGVEASFPLVKEALLFEFSKITPTQLREPGGLDAIAATLSERARSIYPDGEVIRVVLTQLLVQ